MINRQKIGKDYYRLINPNRLHDAVIYLIDGYAYARDGATYKMAYDPIKFEGYVRVNFKDGNWYQCKHHDHLEYTNAQPSVVIGSYLDKLEQYAYKKMYEFQLIQKGWVFRWDNSLQRAGVCKYRDKIIGLSRVIAEQREESFSIDTILHEIAHALTPGANHGPQWVRKAIEIGCNGQRCYSDITPMMKYIATCVNGHTMSRQKKPGFGMQHSCPHCSKSFDPKYILNWELNPNYKS